MKLTYLIILILLPFLSAAQSFEGIVTVEINYDLPAEQQSMLSMLPKSQTFKIKNEWVRMEQYSAAGNFIVISNSESGISTIMIDAEGTKFKTQISQPLEHDNLEITILDETKVILGFNCKKARISTKGGMGDVIVFFTDELPAPRMSNLPKINGFPLEYKMESQGMKVHYVTKEITREPVSNQVFMVPGGFKEMPANMKLMMGLNN